MVFPSSPLQKSSHGFSSPSVFQEEKSKPQLFLHFLRLNNNSLDLNTKKIKRQPNIWNHSRTEMESTDFISLLRMYATTKKKVFPTKTKTLDRARGHKSKRRERVSFVGSRAQNPDLEIRVECRWRIFIPILGPRLAEISGPEKTLTPGLYNSKLFPPKIWTRGCMTKRGGAWQKSVWEPELAASDWLLFKEIAVFIFWTGKVTSDNNIGNSWMNEIHGFNSWVF